VLSVYCMRRLIARTCNKKSIMSCGMDYASRLRTLGFRVTSQRLAVLHVLRHSVTRLSPSQVYRQARQKLPSLTEATVYRTLDFLTENGLVWPVHGDKGHLAYELAGHRHHHLICRQCGGEIEVDHELVEKLYARLEAASGYRLAQDHMAMFGLCPSCQKTSTRKRV
jgi:Fur family transcriptional regulator, ferric uptake regulator